MNRANRVRLGKYKRTECTRRSVQKKWDFFGGTVQPTTTSPSSTPSTLPMQNMLLQSRTAVATSTTLTTAPSPRLRPTGTPSPPPLSPLTMPTTTTTTTTTAASQTAMPTPLSGLTVASLTTTTAATLAITAPQLSQITLLRLPTALQPPFSPKSPCMKSHGPAS